jgi:hypothetical protein
MAVLLWALAAQAGGPRFRAVDVVVDGGDRPLAVYQFELTYDRAACSLVGVEGGERPFAEPPFYDPRGLTAGRVILAAFTLDKSPPRGRVRVARVHLEERGEPGLEVRMVVAGTVGGEKIAASVQLLALEGGGR